MLAKFFRVFIRTSCDFAHNFYNDWLNHYAIYDPLLKKGIKTFDLISQEQGIILYDKDKQSFKSSILFFNDLIFENLEDAILFADLLNNYYCLSEDTIEIYLHDADGPKKVINENFEFVY